MRRSPRSPASGRVRALASVGRSGEDGRDLFAALHVQYSWFGMVLVFALGVTLGLIRKHTSTTAAIVVHGLYDMLAVFAT